MARGIRINAEILRSLSYTDLTTSFTPVGEQTLNAIHIYSIQNQTDNDIYWSWNGETNGGFLPANGGHIILDITTNKKWDQGMYLPVGLQTYVAAVPGQAPATTGAVYVTSFFSQTV
jgi:hypothetical protein